MTPLTLHLMAEADLDSWQWLQDNSKRHAQALAADIRAGATQDEIEAFAARQYPFGSELAIHIPQAAAYLIRQRDSEATP